MNCFDTFGGCFGTWSIDVNMAFFFCPQIAWHFFTPITFPAVTQGVHICNDKLKKALIWMSLMSGSRWRYLVHKKVKSGDSNLVYDLTISNPGSKAVASNAYLGWTVRVLWVMIGVLWKMGSTGQDLSNGTDVASQLANLSVFTSIVCGLVLLCSLLNYYLTVSSYTCSCSNWY
jgi:hypothetical protein